MLEWRYVCYTYIVISQDEYDILVITRVGGEAEDKFQEQGYHTNIPRI